MAYRRQEIGLLAQVDPEEAKRRIVEALQASGCHRDEAASAMGCSKHTLWRWIVSLDLEATITKLEKRAVREGWHHGKRGRPPTPQE